MTQTTTIELCAHAARRAVTSGSTASVLSAVVLAAASRVEEGSAAGALNGPSQWAWGEEEAKTTQLDVRHTVLGYTIHHASSLLWATLHEAVFCGPGRPATAPADKSVAQHCIEAACTASTAYFVDYWLTPKRVRPGFRKHLSPRSIFLVYAAFAAGLAATTITRDARGARAAR